MLAKLKFFVAQSWLLVVSAFFFGLLIAVASAAWTPKIEQNRIAKLNNLMVSVIQSASDFKPALENLTIAVGPKKYTTDIYRALDSSAATAGWTFIVTGSGFADRNELVVGVDAGFEKMTGYDVLYANETPGFGDKIYNDYFKQQFQGAPAGQFELAKAGPVETKDSTIIAITGATVTSEAVISALNAHMKQVRSALELKGLLNAD